eukprot:510305-Rhodomonas_salina.1
MDGLLRDNEAPNNKSFFSLGGCLQSRYPGYLNWIAVRYFWRGTHVAQLGSDEVGCAPALGSS